MTDILKMSARKYWRRRFRPERVLNSGSQGSKSTQLYSKRSTLKPLKFREKTARWTGSAPLMTVEIHGIRRPGTQKMAASTQEYAQS